MSRTTLVALPSPRPQEPFLPGRDRLLADIGARSGGELRLELIVLRDAAGLDPFLLEPAGPHRVHVMSALLSATLEAGSTLYRLDATVFAALASDPRARSAAAA